MGKYIIVGVTGGIAAYKALDVVSGLRKKGIEMNVILTKNASEFVSPLSFQAISNNYVITDTFQEPKNWDVEHISLAKKASLILVAPATANIIGKVANGIADDMLSTTIMAATCPIVFAPAMNTNMYANPIVQKNIEFLKSQEYYFIEPDSGWLACGDLGKGKLAQPDRIIEDVINYLNPVQDLKGQNILVTAGPTVESIDPMRYLTNHSSGKMGYAIAEEAAKRGANVQLISGPTNLQCPKGVNKIGIKSAQDMYDAVMEKLSWSTVVIKAAAVADYRPVQASPSKIKKTDQDMIIELTRNPDILAEVGQQKGEKVLVGFAAETTSLLEYATEKINKKNLDFIVANNISEPGAGFQGDTNIATIIDREGHVEELPKMNKAELANIILNKVKNLLQN
ncbi:MAG: bifunctional phosphopantothenoylcysteine decarboxylase/phosphopantothenate--cysteine ligase CoaBC [Epulopiscium sp.]|nr:bifunctional phosphopantothenoylcysteine decarboxylase/phosphopantothenate--cysteine ligase CoaBC [Candidatus Epulonipiscium sp.]